MNINLVELWSDMGLPVKIVVAILTLQAIASIAVAIDRWILGSPAASVGWIG